MGQGEGLGVGDLMLTVHTKIPQIFKVSWLGV